MNPVKIKVESGALFIFWSDGEENSVKLTNLRYFCPCALCVDDKNKKGEGFIPLYTNDETAVSEIKTIGNYAIGITWKDGHNTGIYNFEYLYNLTARKR